MPGRCGKQPPSYFRLLYYVKTLRTVYPDECKGLISAGKCAVKFGGGLTALYAGVLQNTLTFEPTS